MSKGNSLNPSIDFRGHVIFRGVIFGINFLALMQMPHFPQLFGAKKFRSKHGVRKWFIANHMLGGFSLTKVSGVFVGRHSRTYCE